ncbi:TraB/GumN family protein [Arenibacter sp. N53]|uniref:TraB/GumN family protein n=1 Tax=Arenibacter TaxID=178469 RepID=UPI000CD44137|nr:MULTISPECIES: TraB/GumN family protein [Arenibacter]MCM4153943.1 TraB/GumN family protein [Arenibacter sp. N53]
MTVRRITTQLFLILTSTIILGQNGKDSLRDNTILFKITSQDSNETSYIFGTHHAFGKSFFDSLTKANQALESCDLLIKENLNIPGKLAEDIINHRTSKTQWNKYLSIKDLTFIENLFATSPTDYNKMTPTEMYVFLNRHFKQQVCLNKNDNDTSLSLDDYIGSIAIERNIELYGLETTEEQIVLINKDVAGMPRKSHKRRLANIIDKISAENSNYCEETDWYSNMEIDFKNNEPCRNSLVLTDRNNKWMGSIREKLESNNCFIAVGLSHLMYECGLINQLKELGYIITPLEVN